MDQLVVAATRNSAWMLLNFSIHLERSLFAPPRRGLGNSVGRYCYPSPASANHGFLIAGFLFARHSSISGSIMDKRQCLMLRN